MVAAPTHSVPAPQVYLCQVDDATSCGACCGLYNVVDNGRRALEELLTERTARFCQVPREIEPLDRFARWSAGRAGTPPLARFHHCPFLGLIGEARGRVGCLLHPLAAGNGGVDLRGLSHYGSFTCRTYFCPASRKLEERYQRILKAVLGHWYAYGLIVTETKLVRLLLGAVEARLAAALPPEAELTAGARAALAQLLGLKIDWPFRSGRDRQEARIHYLFNDGAHGRPDFVSALTIHQDDAPYSALFRELVSTFGSADQERAARRQLAAAIDRAAAALRQPQADHQRRTDAAN